MSWSLSDILQHALTFERTAVTPYTFTTVSVPVFISFYVMAVLVQLPHTSLYRKALLPIVFWLAFRAGMSLDFSGNYPGYAHFNQGLTLAMFTVSMRSTAWVFAEKTYARLPIRKSGNGTIVNGHDEKTPIERDVRLSVAMWNAWDLLVNLRGIGWVGPQKMYIPTPYFQVESRSTFFFLSLSRAALLGLMSDFMGRYVRSFGPDTFGTSKGGSLFDPSLPPLQRYRNSSIVTMMAGFAAYAVIDAIYHLHAALYTVLFQQHPTLWPPLFDSPWLSTSLTSFWGERWHQLFRNCFVVVGGKPAEKIFGRAGIVLGAFAISGFLHDVGMRGMGRGADTLEVVGFFLSHGVGVILERAWKKTTGRRVGGVIGLLWVYLWFLLTGHIFVDVWARRGLLGSEFIPEAYLPSTLLMNWISQRNGSL